MRSRKGNCGCRLGGRRGFRERAFGRELFCEGEKSGDHTQMALKPRDSEVKASDVPGVEADVRSQRGGRLGVDFGGICGSNVLGT